MSRNLSMDTFLFNGKGLVSMMELAIEPRTKKMCIKTLFSAMRQVGDTF